MKIKDVTIFIDSYFQDADYKIKESFPPLNNKVYLQDDIFIDLLPPELSHQIFSDCKPKGFSDAIPQFEQLYSFIRYNAPSFPRYIWDKDERLQVSIFLSRIIHPTTIGFEYSARIFYENEKILEIIPGPVQDFGSFTWIAGEDSRNWLTEVEGKELTSLINAYYNTIKPKRIQQALWYLEYAFRTFFTDIRWPLICMGLESLIHTDRNLSTRQFSLRVAYLAQETGICDLSIDKAEEAYSLRSTLVHGQTLYSLENHQLELYEKLETLLRKVLKKAILDESFSSIFDSSDKIREKWPIK